MNKLDTFLQNASRTADAQSAKPAAPAGGDGGAMANGAFDALLRRISEKPQGESLQIRHASLDIKAPLSIDELHMDGLPTKDSPALEGAMSSSILSPEVAALNAPEVAKPDVQLGMLIQSGLPSQSGIAPRAEQTVPPAATSAPQTSLLDIVQLPTEGGREADILRSFTGAPALKASVVHQETHFKPIPSGMVLDAANPQVGDTQGKPPVAVSMPGVHQVLSATSFEKVGPSSALQDSVGDRNSGEFALSSNSPLDADNSESIPSMSVLQRIASAVMAESEPVSPRTDVQANRTGASPLVSAKASEGVIRILNIQLHPAELGLVTVKMRLSGDKLEMELQASSEETADLLRRDSEKLSGLLRTSGYRPDSLIISAGAVDAPQQDGSSAQRQQSGSQPHSQSGNFQQGSAHSDGQPRGNAREFENGAQRDQRSTVDEKSAAVRSPGDLYL